MVLDIYGLAFGYNQSRLFGTGILAHNEMAQHILGINKHASLAWRHWANGVQGFVFLERFLQYIITIILMFHLVRDTLS